ncbi:hypothetical protein ACEYYB_03250 [Paracoccus sp. p4-l81]|uniref:hypothetical protein n=1 Tax=Paracoccus sp. p4-l81 TaxID=3342806 RepID=UPI0035BB8998
MTLKRDATAMMLALLLAAQPAGAEPVQPEPPGLIDRLIGGLFDQMLSDAAPHLDNITRDMGLLADAMAPTFDRLGVLIDDIGNYQAPERLANGDILIRRKPGAPPAPELPDLPPAPEGPADPLAPFRTTAPIDL